MNKEILRKIDKLDNLMLKIDKIKLLKVYFKSEVVLDEVFHDNFL